MINIDTIKDQLIQHEGLRLKPYIDSVGKLTIGVGRNLDDVGISKSEAMTLLDNDIDRTIAALEAHLPAFNSLDEPRQTVLVNMAFNLGIAGLLKFHRMLTYIEEAQYIKAQEEMLSSKWAIQVGQRAKDLAALLTS